MRALSLFQVNYFLKAFFNTLLLVYDTCRGQKKFTFQFPGKCDPAKKSEHPMSTAWSSLYMVGFFGTLLNSFFLYVAYGERQTFIKPVSAMIWLVGY